MRKLIVKDIDGNVRFRRNLQPHETVKDIKNSVFAYLSLDSVSDPKNLIRWSLSNTDGEKTLEYSQDSGSDSGENIPKRSLISSDNYINSDMKIKSGIIQSAYSGNKINSDEYYYYSKNLKRKDGYERPLKKNKTLFETKYQNLFTDFGQLNNLNREPSLLSESSFTLNYLSQKQKDIYEFASFKRRTSSLHPIYNRSQPYTNQFGFISSSRTQDTNFFNFYYLIKDSSTSVRCSDIFSQVQNLITSFNYIDSLMEEMAICASYNIDFSKNHEFSKTQDNNTNKSLTRSEIRHNEMRNECFKTRNSGIWDDCINQKNFINLQNKTYHRKGHFSEYESKHLFSSQLRNTTEHSASTNLSLSEYNNDAESFLSEIKTFYSSSKELKIKNMDAYDVNFCSKSDVFEQKFSLKKSHLKNNTKSFINLVAPNKLEEVKTIHVCSDKLICNKSALKAYDKIKPTKLPQHVEFINSFYEKISSAPRNLKILYNGKVINEDTCVASLENDRDVILVYFFDRNTKNIQSPNSTTKSIASSRKKPQLNYINNASPLKPSDYDHLKNINCGLNDPLMDTTNQQSENDHTDDKKSFLRKIQTSNFNVKIHQELNRNSEIGPKDNFHQNSSRILRISDQMIKNATNEIKISIPKFTMYTNPIHDAHTTQISAENHAFDDTICSDSIQKTMKVSVLMNGRKIMVDPDKIVRHQNKIYLVTRREKKKEIATVFRQLLSSIQIGLVVKISAIIALFMSGNQSFALMLISLMLLKYLSRLNFKIDMTAKSLKEWFCKMIVAFIVTMFCINSDNILVFPKKNKARKI